MRWLCDNHIELLGIDEDKSEDKIAMIEGKNIRLPLMIKRFVDK